MFYDNAVCDGCGQPLLENEDIVVCPDCGTPQHRACYELNNKCVNEHLHESGFEWKNPNPPVVESPKEEPVQETESDQTDDTMIPVGLPTPALDVNPAFFTSAGLDPNAEFDGVSTKDAVSYTQIGAKRYVKKFLRSDGKKFFISWNWGAFFFSPAWFFYRKLYKVGFVFISLVIALNLFLMPQIDKIGKAYEPMQTAYSEYTEALTEYSKNQNNETKAVYEQKQAELSKITYQIMPAAAGVFIGTFLIPNFIAALIANGLYKRKMLEDIKFAHKSSKDPKIVKYSLLRRGGVAFLPAAAAFLAQDYLPTLILQLVNSIFS